MKFQRKLGLNALRSSSLEELYVNFIFGCLKVSKHKMFLHELYAVSSHICLSYNMIRDREPRGFGFVQFVDPIDAEDAKYHMDGQILLGRELTVVFAEENRKKPSDMRARERLR